MRSEFDFQRMLIILQEFCLVIFENLGQLLGDYLFRLTIEQAIPDVSSKGIHMRFGVLSFKNPGTRQTPRPDKILVMVDE